MSARRQPGPARVRLRSPVTGFLVALVLAMTAAVTQGVVYQGEAGPGNAQSARIGESLSLGGTRIVVDSITVAPELPAAEAGEGPVAGPAGSVLVLVVFTQVVDASVDRETHTCSSTLVADDQTEWPTDDGYGYRLRRPEGLVCGDTDSSPLVSGQAREIGVSYLVPARYADQLRWRLSVDGGRYLVEVRP